MKTTMFREYPLLINPHSESYFPMEEKGNKVNLHRIDMPIGVLISNTRDSIILLTYDID